MAMYPSASPVQLAAVPAELHIRTAGGWKMSPVHASRKHLPPLASYYNVRASRCGLRNAVYHTTVNLTL